MKSLSQSRWIYAIPVVVFVVVLAFLIVSASRESESYLRDRALQTERSIRTIVGGFEAMADLIVETEVRRPQVLSLLAQALDAPTPEARQVYRQRLLALWEPLYASMAPLGFRQFHFHFPDNRSFLRVHSPGKFGDDLTGGRPAVARTNRDGVKTVACEEGRTFCGFRFVYPLVWQGRHVGSVETGISPVSVVRELAQIDDAVGTESAMLLLMRGDVVREKLWEEDQARFVPSGFSEEFLVDRVVSTFEDDPVRHMGRELLKEALPRMEKGEAFVVPVHFAPTYCYLVEFFPETNVQGEMLGCLVYYHRDKGYVLLKREFQIKLLGLVLLALLSFAFCFLRYRFYLRLQALATTDFLTGVNNRRALLERMEGMRYIQDRYGRPMSVVMFDVDNFKDVNDTYGHSVGDTVLKEITGICLAQLRESDMLARWGGDEFVIVLPETSLHGARSLAERLRAKVEERFRSEEYDVTLSLGVCEGLCEGPLDSDRIFACVDAALYRAKEKGRNRVETGDASGSAPEWRSSGEKPAS